MARSIRRHRADKDVGGLGLRRPTKAPREDCERLLADADQPHPIEGGFVVLPVAVRVPAGPRQHADALVIPEPVGADPGLARELSRTQSLFLNGRKTKPWNRLQGQGKRAARTQKTERATRRRVANAYNPLMLRSRLIAAPLSALLWGSFVAIVIVWTPLVLLYRLVTFPRDPDRYRVGRLFHRSAALAARINPFWTFRILDDVRPNGRKPYVFVANHSSFTDVFLLATLPWEMKFLSKKSIFRIPLLGWQMTVAGDVPIVRGNRESTLEAIRGLRERLDRRVSVFFFPEGTRSADGTLGQFREGAFRLAIEAGVEVLPLAIVGAGGSLPKHSFVFHPAAATLIVLAPEPTAGLSAADAPKLAETVRQRIKETIQKTRDSAVANS